MILIALFFDDWKGTLGCVLTVSGKRTPDAECLRWNLSPATYLFGLEQLVPYLCVSFLMDKMGPLTLTPQGDQPVHTELCLAHGNQKINVSNHKYCKY